MRIGDFVKDFKNRHGRMPRVGLYGFGVTNRALYKALLSEGVTDFTLRADAPGDYIPFAPAYFGVRSADRMEEDVLFLSPSVRRESCEAVKRATSLGIPLSSDCELFFDKPHIPTLAVTGSDGKSTVTALVGHFLSASGRRVECAGNFGLPFCKIGPNTETCVAELSSFNLRYAAPKTRRAVITNITENHLNWHNDFEEYKNSKINLFQNCEKWILSADDPQCRDISRLHPPFATFSANEEYDSLRARGNAEHYITAERGGVCLDGSLLFPLSAESVIPTYAVQNLLAAVGLTLGYVEPGLLKATWETFTPLPHRAEVCHRHEGIDFINSSIDTTPTRCATTLEGIGKSVLIILGGKGKGLSYEPLIKPLSQYARAIALYGEAGSELEDFLRASPQLANIPRGRFEGFCDALAWLCRRAVRGDTVLLCPAATAYGEFSDYTARGRCFTDYVKNKFR